MATDARLRQALTAQETAAGFKRAGRRVAHHAVCGTTYPVGMGVTVAFARDAVPPTTMLCPACNKRVPVDEIKWVTEDRQTITNESPADARAIVGSRGG
jgi:hypothetical protein